MIRQNELDSQINVEEPIHEAPRIPQLPKCRQFSTLLPPKRADAEAKTVSQESRIIREQAENIVAEGKKKVDQRLKDSSNINLDEIRKIIRMVHHQEQNEALLNEAEKITQIKNEKPNPQNSLVNSDPILVDDELELELLKSIKTEKEPPQLKNTEDNSDDTIHFEDFLEDELEAEIQNIQQDELPPVDKDVDRDLLEAEGITFTNVTKSIYFHNGYDTKNEPDEEEAMCGSCFKTMGEDDWVRCDSLNDCTADDSRGWFHRKCALGQSSKRLRN